MTRAIPRVENLKGRLRVPSSKSLTNRALILALATSGPTTIGSPLDCDDSRYLLEAIRKIGFDVSGSLRSEVTIGDRLTMYAGDLELFVGNAGTAMRFLSGTLPFIPGRFVLQGEQRMHERPIGHLVEALVALGAEIEYLEQDGYPPVAIRGRKMRGGMKVAVDGSLSSQFVSALMMGGVHLPGGLTVVASDSVSRPYIELTAGIISAFGFPVAETGAAWKVAPANANPGRYEVEGDFSAASYWFAAAVATRGEVVVEGLSASSLQGDRRLLEVLETMGVEVEWMNDGAVRVNGERGFTGGDLDLNSMPDVAPTVAAIAPFASGTVRIRNVGNLRIKESDRLAVLERELTALGARATAGEDFIVIEPGWGDEESTVDPSGDHRIAMAFAVAGLARGGVKIGDPGVVGKSYPGFWKALDGLVESSR